MDCKLSRDITVHYEEFGEGRPLFALHGWGLDHRHLVWELEPNFVERKGWRRIYPDLPGMGKTQGADWITNEDQILEIILEFIGTIAPAERFTIGGHSYGAYLTRGVLMKKGSQVDGAFLNAPSISWEKNEETLPKQTVVKEDSGFLAALKPEEQGFRDLFVSQSLEALNNFRNFYLPTTSSTDTGFLERLRESGAFSFEADLPAQAFAAPTLIITGRHDNWVGYHDAFALVRNFPRATYVVLDGAGHALAIEQKTLHRALINEWLDRVEDYLSLRNQNSEAG